MIFLSTEMNPGSFEINGEVFDGVAYVEIDGKLYHSAKKAKYPEIQIVIGPKRCTCGAVWTKEHAERCAWALQFKCRSCPRKFKSDAARRIHSHRKHITEPTKLLLCPSCNIPQPLYHYCNGEPCTKCLKLGIHECPVSILAAPQDTPTVAPQWEYPLEPEPDWLLCRKGCGFHAWNRGDIRNHEARCKRFRCPECNLRVRNIHEHHRLYHTFMVRCTLCDKVADPYWMERHFVQKHGQHPVWVCDCSTHRILKTLVKQCYRGCIPDKPAARRAV